MDQPVVAPESTSTPASLGSESPPSAIDGRSLVASEFIRRHNIGFAWIVVALLGTAAIMLFRGADAARLIVPCGLMAAYLAYSLSQQSKNLERIGDSVYFLGFLWTLFALTDALIFRRASDVGVQEVFAIFGYALVTTGLGMFLRMAVLQFRYSVPDQLEDERAELARQVNDFRHELVQTSEAVATFRQSALVNAQGWLQDWRKQNEAALRGVVEDSSTAVGEVRSATAEVTKEIKTIAESARQASLAMTSVTKTTTSVTRRLGENEEKWLKTLEDGVGQLSNAISTWVARVEQSELPSDEIRERVSQVLHPLDESCVQLTKTLKDTAAGSDALRARVHTLVPEITQLSTRLAAAATQLREFGDTMAQSQQTAHTFWTWWRSR